jgi:hypothetical protein
MTDRRDDARPRLEIVNKAIQEIVEKLWMHDDCKCTKCFSKMGIEDILNKYDLNYNDTKRWSIE